MKKILTLLGIAVLLLVACGNETTTKHPKQKEGYRYVEIDECTIPIPERFKELDAGKTNLYRFGYSTNISVVDSASINISKNKEDDYIDTKNLIMQNKGTQLKSDFYRNHFKIIDWDLIDPVYGQDNFELFGPKTRISLINSNKKELNYLLDYCKQTWKLDKGEE